MKMHDVVMSRMQAAEDWAEHYFRHLFKLVKRPLPPRRKLGRDGAFYFHDRTCSFCYQIFQMFHDSSM